MATTTTASDLDAVRAIVVVVVVVVVAAGAAMATGNELPPMVAPLVAEALGDARLELLDGVTHFAPMEDGALVAGSILDHLGRSA